MKINKIVCSCDTYVGPQLHGNIAAQGVAGRVKQEYSHMVTQEAVVGPQLHGNIAANLSIPLWNVAVWDPNRVLLQQSSYSLFVCLH